MTRAEAIKILAVLKAVYPSIGRDDPESTARAWAVALKEVPYAAVSRGTADYIKAEHFPPAPADLMRYAKRYYLVADRWREKFWADALETGCLDVAQVERARAACRDGAARIAEKKLDEGR